MRVGLGVGDGVGLGVGQGVGLGVGLVGDGVGLGVGDGVGLGVGDGVGLGVGDGVGLMASGSAWVIGSFGLGWADVCGRAGWVTALGCLSVRASGWESGLVTASVTG